MRVCLLTNVSGLVLFEDGICKLLVDKDIVVPALFFDAAVCSLVPEDVMEERPKD